MLRDDCFITLVLASEIEIRSAEMDFSTRQEWLVANPGCGDTELLLRTRAYRDGELIFTHNLYVRERHVTEFEQSNAKFRLDLAQSMALDCRNLAEAYLARSRVEEE